MQSKIQELKVPLLPRSISGLKKDGTIDKRFSYSFAKIKEDIMRISGIPKYYMSPKNETHRPN